MSPLFALQRAGLVRRGVASSKLFFAVGMLAVGAQQAAASTYAIYGDNTIYTNLPPYSFNEGYFNQTAQVPISNAANYNYSTTYMGAQHQDLNVVSSANQASAHLSVNTSFLETQAQSDSTTYKEFEADGAATVTLTDLIISGPGTGNISTAVHMHVDGSLSSTAQYDSGTRALSSSAAINTSLTYNNQAIGSGSVGSSSANGNAAEPSATGWMTGFNGSQDVTSDMFSVPLNTAFSLTFTLSGSSISFLQGDDSGLAESYADFGNTFSFATDQPVFALPLGYTADSVSAGLVANQYTELPEPGMAGIFAASVVTIARRRRRRIVD